MGASTVMMRVDSVPQDEWAAMSSLAADATALSGLADNAEALNSLAEKATELLELLETEEEPEA